MKENKPCLLLLNDIHISKDNIPAFQANWQEAMGICRERDIREVVVGGDLFFSRAAQTLDVLLAVRDMLVSAADHDIHVTLAEGNHDKVNQESLRGYCHVFDRHPNVTVVDEYLTLCRPEWKFALHVMSYFPEDGSFAERLGRLAAEALSGEPEHFLYIHEGINGALAQPSEKELPARIFSPFDKVFVGHYHNRTVIPGTGIDFGSFISACINFLIIAFIVFCLVKGVNKMRSVGKKKEDALKMGEIFLKMIQGEASEDEIDSLEEASALRDIAHMPARVKCAVLGWRTLKEALLGGDELS